MTLDYSIDDVDFRALVDEALRRIPTASRGNWTLHAAVDPGITLTELFAWLLEQRLYWADQVTAPLLRRLLALFADDIEGPRPAATVLSFDPELFVEPGDAGRALFPHADVPRRTAFRVPETDLVFTLRQGLTALALARPQDPGPVRPPFLHLGGTIAAGAAEDLRGGGPVELMTAGGGRSEARIGLELQAAPPAAARRPVSILFELDTSVAPEWSPDAAEVGLAADVAWQYRTSDVNETWRPLPELRDGTLGLRRSGLLRFALPADWSASQLDADRRRIGWLRAVTAASTYSAPPVALAIVPNSAIAWHLRWTRQASTLDWLPLPGRTVQLEARPLPLPDRTVVSVLEAGPPSRRWRWRVVPDFVGAGPKDRVVVVDRERARVVFGDGLTGRLPRLHPGATDAVVISYAGGGGDAGNIDACAWDAIDLTGPLPKARNVVPAIGGRDGEDLESARHRAATGLATPNRAVTAADHQTIACATPGVAVARAHAEVGFDRAECGLVPGVTTVFVVPGARSRTVEAVRAGKAVAAPVADPGLLAAVRAQFARTRLVGEVVHVEAAAYRHLRVRATVTGAPRDRDGLRRRLAGALRVFLDPLVGDDGTGWPFGQPIRPTALLGVAQRAIADRGEVAAVAAALDGGDLRECDDLALRPYELIAVDAIEVVIDPAPATDVGLQ